IQAQVFRNTLNWLGAPMAATRAVRYGRHSPAPPFEIKDRARTRDRPKTTNRSRIDPICVVDPTHMQFRHLVLSLAVALIIATPLRARADAPLAKDVATIDNCLRKQDKKKG